VCECNDRLKCKLLILSYFKVIFCWLGQPGQIPSTDIVFWSQTSWKWSLFSSSGCSTHLFRLEIKLTELGILLHPDYRVCFVLDKSCDSPFWHVTQHTQKHFLSFLWCISCMKICFHNLNNNLRLPQITRVYCKKKKTT